jgi:hypothetical protein
MLRAPSFAQQLPIAPRWEDDAYLSATFTQSVLPRLCHTSLYFLKMFDPLRRSTNGITPHFHPAQWEVYVESDL